MRKAVGLLFAASLLVPIGLVATSSAGGAAAKAPTCKTLKGTQTYSPGLPVITSSAKVTSKVTVKSTIGGCTGGPVKGVTGATSLTKSTYKGNCLTLISHKGATTGTAVLMWSNHKTSNITTSLVTTSKAGASPVLATLTSKFVKGQFVGTTSVVHIKATPKSTACKTTPLTGYSFVNVGGFTTK
jgi:hypothetical protein